MTTTEINYKSTDYICRIVTSNEGESLIIGGLELLAYLKYFDEFCIKVVHTMV